MLEYNNINEEFFIALNKEGDKRVHGVDGIAEEAGEGAHFDEALTIENVG